MAGMRLQGVVRFHRARDTEEARSLLAGYGGRAALLAGGTDVARSPRRDIEGLIDITDAGLSYVAPSDQGGLSIGATTTLGELLDNAHVADHAVGVMREALEAYSVPPLRNTATIGGSVVSAHPWADMPTLLVALGAEVRWEDGARQRAALEDVYAGRFREVFRQAVLTEIRLPRWTGAFAFGKLTRSQADIALVNAVCGVGVEDGRVTWARVAVGAMPARGQRIPWAEEVLTGEMPGPRLWSELAAMVSERLETSDDRRAEGAWRRKAAGSMIARLLARAAERTQG